MTVRAQDLVGLYELFSRHKYERFADNFADDATYHNVSAGIEALGRDDIVAMLKMWPIRFADLKVTAIRAEKHASPDRRISVPDADYLFQVKYRIAGRYVDPFPGLARMSLAPAKGRIVAMNCSDFIWLNWARRVLRTDCFMDTIQLFIQ